MKPLALLLAALASAQPRLDDTVERARREFDVPGVAVAIVKDGRVVLAKGWGVRTLGKPDPVTADTLFGIASNTKAFTAAALAMLVDEKRIAWDDRVVDHLPAFQMYDPYVTRELTVRDTLVHRSGLGLGAGDLMFWPRTDLSRDEVVRRLRFIKPASSFRSRYAYDNILYLVAGQIVAAAGGKSWDDFIVERIFRPLGMNSSNTSVRLNPKHGDVATPHAPLDGKPQPIQPSEFDNNAPCGGVNSSVADMAKWIVAQLNEGESNGKRLFSAAQSREMWSPQTVMPTPRAAVGGVRPNFVAYGLGWVVSDYRGKKVVYHTGGLSGYVSRVTLLPELKLGMVVLTNQEARGAYMAISNTVLDHYLKSDAPDWIAIYRDLQKKQEAEAAEVVARSAAKRNAGSRPALPLAAYAGRYRDPWYGDVFVEERDGRLGIRFAHSPGLTGALEHFQYDTFIARWRDRTLMADAYITFSLKPDGSVDQARMAAVSPLTDFSYDFHDLDLKRQ
jgi:CubicO group peptidase (beta-lactamase class C family)